MEELCPFLCCTCIFENNIVKVDVPTEDCQGLYLSSGTLPRDVTYTHQDVLPAAGIKFYLVISSWDAPSSPPAPQMENRRND